MTDTDINTDQEVRQEYIQQYRGLRNQYRALSGLTDFNEVVLYEITVRNLPKTPGNWIEQGQYVVDVLSIECLSEDFDLEGSELRLSDV